MIDGGTESVAPCIIRRPAGTGRGTLWMLRHGEPAMRTIVERSGVELVTIGELPGLDASGRLVLARRRADEGVVVVGPDAARVCN